MMGSVANPTASVIIPAFNKAELTHQCLCAISSSSDPVPVEVIVVDNASTDGTPAVLARFPWVRVIRNSENLGFARACNQGARMARGRYVVFLNNDTIPLHGWLEPLVREAEADPRVGMVGSKLLYEDGTIQHAGVVFARQSRIPYHPYRFLPSAATCVNRRREMQAVTAACVLLPRDLFLSMDGFCEDYQNGWEDLDLCVRMRLKKHTIIYQPASVLYHLESQSPGRMDRDDQNKTLFFQKWQGLVLSDEDSYYLQDGSCLGWVQGSHGQVRVRPFRSERERMQWARPVQLQRAAAEADLDTMRASFLLPMAWPDDPFVLNWGGLVAVALGFRDEARIMLQRALAMTDTLEIRVWLATLLGVEGVLPEGAENHHKELALRFAREALANGDCQAALHLHSRALGMGGGSKETLYGMLEASLELGDRATQAEAASGLTFLGETGD